MSAKSIRNGSVFDGGASGSTAGFCTSGFSAAAAPRVPDPGSPSASFSAFAPFSSSLSFASGDVASFFSTTR